MVVAAFLLVAGAALTVRPSPASASRFRRLAQSVVLSDAALILIGLLVIVAIGAFIAPYLRTVAPPSSTEAILQVTIALGRVGV